jgi:hypothetical protein
VAASQAARSSAFAARRASTPAASITADSRRATAGPEEGPGVGTEADRRRLEAWPCGERLDVDLGPALAGRRDRVAVGADLRQPAAQHEQRVGGLEPVANDARSAVTGHAEIERMVVRDHVAAPPAGDDRDVEQLGELQQVGRRPGPEDAGAGKDHRTASGRDELEHGPNVVRLRPGRRGANGVELRALRQNLVEEILGERQEGRSGAAQRGPRGIASPTTWGTSDAFRGSAAYAARPPNVAV